MQQSFFNTDLLALKNAQVKYTPNFFPTAEADIIFQELKQKTPWQEDDIKVFGKIYKQPRLTALYGTKSYSYASINMHPIPFTATLLKIKDAIEKYSGDQFNVCLLNRYRSGSDSNGWHSDDEKSLGKNPIISSLSFGGTRNFKMRHKTDSTLKFTIPLEHNSLLEMKGETQHFWQHQIPKTKKDVSERINLTFRWIN